MIPVVFHAEALAELRARKLRGVTGMAGADSELTVTFTLTEEDMIRLNVVILRRRKILLWIGIVMGVLLSPCLAFALYNASELKPDNWLFGVLLLVLVLLILFVYIPWMLRQQVRKAFRNSPNARLDTTYRFTSRGLAFHSAVARIDVTWEAITEVLETNADFIFLFASKQSACLVPKGALSSPDEWQQLRRIVTAGVGERAKLQPDEDEVQS